MVNAPTDRQPGECRQVDRSAHTGREDAVQPQRRHPPLAGRRRPPPYTPVSSMAGSTSSHTHSRNPAAGGVSAFRASSNTPARLSTTASTAPAVRPAERLDPAAGGVDDAPDGLPPPRQAQGEAHLVGHEPGVGGGADGAEGFVAPGEERAERGHGGRLRTAVRGGTPAPGRGDGRRVTLTPGGPRARRRGGDGFGMVGRRGNDARRTRRSPPFPGDFQRQSVAGAVGVRGPRRRPQAGPGAVASRPHDLRAGDGLGCSKLAGVSAKGRRSGGSPPGRPARGGRDDARNAASRRADDGGLSRPVTSDFTRRSCSGSSRTPSGRRTRRP